MLPTYISKDSDDWHFTFQSFDSIVNRFYPIFFSISFDYWTMWQISSSAQQYAAMSANEVFFLLFWNNVSVFDSCRATCNHPIVHNFVDLRFWLNLFSRRRRKIAHPHTQQICLYFQCNKKFNWVFLYVMRWRMNAFERAAWQSQQ